MILKIYKRLKGIFQNWYCTHLQSLTISGKVIFQGIPDVIKHATAQIRIGNGCTINSVNHGYHINMFQKCKLYADRPNAVIIIGECTRIHSTCIHAYNKIEIGNNCLVAANTQIIDGNGHQLSFDAPHNRINTTDYGQPIIISDNVWIAASCIILGGTTIGQGSVITANSVVKGDVPAMCIYGGNPAKVIKQY